MGVRLIEREQVVRSALDTLRVSRPGGSLSSEEGLANLLRRLASFHCPCSRRTLRKAALQTLSHLTDQQDLDERVDDLLESLISYGDLVEAAVQEAKGEAGRPALLYLAPPQAVPLKDRSIVVLGIEPDDQTALPESMEDRLTLNGHVRRLYETSGETLEQLVALGFIVVPEALWLKAPPPLKSSELITTYNLKLTKAPQAGGSAELRVLRPATSVRFYRGRWGSSDGITGPAIARREQRFGADVWSYVDFSGGKAVRIYDLGHTDLRGWDEAWRLQAALDASAGNPQVFRVEHREQDPVALLHLYHPVPAWVGRWLDAVAAPVPRRRGSLMTFNVPVDAIKAVEALLGEHLWMRRLPEEEA
jgi:hypothetical protein